MQEGREIMDKPESENIKTKIEYQRLKCRVYLVKESNDRRKIKLEDSKDVYNLVKDELCSSDREIFLSILLSTNNTLIGIETVAVGTLNSVYTSPREIFKICDPCQCRFHHSLSQPPFRKSSTQL